MSTIAVTRFLLHPEKKLFGGQGIQAKVSKQRAAARRDLKIDSSAGSQGAKRKLRVTWVDHGRGWDSQKFKGGVGGRKMTKHHTSVATAGASWRMLS